MLGYLIAYWMFKHSSCKSEIEEDLKRHTNKLSFLSFINIIRRKGNCFRNIFYARICKEFPLLTKVSKVFARQMTGLEIDVAEHIGAGMRVFHGYSTIVYAQSIGDNFNVYQNVTIGRGKMINGMDIPTIGNNVTIYTGAIVVGGVHIGDNVKIGAGAVVVKDIPAGSTVVGSSIRIL